MQLPYSGGTAHHWLHTGGVKAAIAKSYLSSRGKKARTDNAGDRVTKPWTHIAAGLRVLVSRGKRARTDNAEDRATKPWTHSHCHWAACPGEVASWASSSQRTSPDPSPPLQAIDQNNHTSCYLCSNMSLTTSNSQSQSWSLMWANLSWYSTVLTPQ